MNYKKKKKNDVDDRMPIFKGLVTPFELMERHDKVGDEFVIEDGKVTTIIIHP